MLAVALTGCGGSGGSTSAPPPSGSSPPDTSPPADNGSTPPNGPSLSGDVVGGRHPIAAATVTAWAANPTPGAPATELGKAVTDAAGHFKIAFAAEPGTGQIVYVTAAGGDAGAGSVNHATELVTVAGVYCVDTAGCAFPASVTINEVTTGAAAYSLAAFMSLSAGRVNVAGASPGLDNAAATFASMIDVQTGILIFQDASACTGDSEPVNCDALRKLNTLANFAAACVDSSGADSDVCRALSQETGATTVLAAWLAIAVQPGVRNDGAGIFALAPPPTVYAPALAVAPNDWTLALSYTGGGMQQPAGIAVDGAGNVWVANFKQPAGTVSKFAPDGAALSGDSGFTGGGLQGSWGLAIDAGGNVWIANWNGGDGKGVTELAADGTPLSGPTGFVDGGEGPISVAVAPDGSIWVANYGDSTLSRFDAAGHVSGPYHDGGLAFPVAVAVDAQNNVWIANQGADSVSEFTTDGTPVSPADGYTGGGLDTPDGLALDARGNAWISDFFGDAVSELAGGDTRPADCPAAPATGDTGCPLSPADGYAGGGMAGANGVAIDGAGHVFVSNFHSDSISELAPDGSPLSPTSGYRNGALVQPQGLAVDASGNLWVADFGGDAVTKFIGIAAPVKTPLIGLPRTF